MVAGAFTIGFHALAAVVVRRRVDFRLLLLSLGTLPFAWITLCGLAGLADTLLGLPPLWSLGAVLALLCVAVVVSARSDLQQLSRPSISPVSATALLIASGIAAAIAIRAQRLEPWGGWDAMFTWVLRGRFFFAGGDLWRNTFSNDLALLHPDYPPLLGWALHALWRLDGGESSAGVACLYSVFWPGFLLVMLGWQRARNPEGPLRLSLPLAVLLSTPLLWKLAAGKMADFILACAIAASAAWYCTRGRSAGSRGIVVAAFLAGWAGLIKNEGILWFLAFGVVAGVGILRCAEDRSRRVREAVLGAAFPALALLLFKLLLAPPTDLFAPGRVFEIGEVVQPGVLVNPAPLIVRIDQVFDGWRHGMIWRFAGDAVSNSADWGLAGWLVIFLAVCRLRRPRQCPALSIALLIQAAGYYAVYLITPYHPYWHLSTSLSRLAAHLLPAAIGLLSIEYSGAAPESPSPGQSRWATANAWLAAAYLMVVPILSLRALDRGDWQLGEQPRVNLTAMADIEFPRVATASYVSSDLGARGLYGAQFESVPTILVVDRRESVVLARFASEEDLRAYCNRNGWQLEVSRNGTGWAIDAGGDGLRQPVTVPRIE